MGNPSPVAAAFQSAFEREFLPLLKLLGFVAGKPKKGKPGLIVALATRALTPESRLEVMLWCQAERPLLRFRFDRVEPIQGVECSGQIALDVPWQDPAFPKPLSLDSSANEFLPTESPERLSVAITFLAGAFAASLPTRAQEVPELSEALRAAAATAEWKAAVDRAKELWEKRHMRGEVDEREVPATLVFMGANLVTLEAEGERLTFRMDTKALDRGLPWSVSRWIKNPAGSLVALRLINGKRAWDFDARGQFLGEAGKASR